MAIDDNTLYGLYGSQIKDLPEKINAVKGLARELTTADYNWPTTGTKNAIALWLLDSGVYTNPSSLSVKAASNHNSSNIGQFVVKKAESNDSRGAVVDFSNAVTSKVYTSLSPSGGSYSSADLATTVVDNLTDSSPAKALSAKQGKTLKDFIGDLTNLTTTDKTNLVAAINEAAAGGGGDTVYSSKTTSNSATGGAVYIGNLGTDQTEVADPTTTDNHYKYFWALPASNNGASYGLPGNGSVNIMGSAKGAESVAIGNQAGMSSYGAAYSIMIGSDANAGPNGVSIGYSSGTSQDYVGNVCIGANSKITSAGVTNSVALGRYSTANRSGEVNVGTGISHPTDGFNSTQYRVIGGVHDPVDNHDAATKGYVDTAVAGAGASAFTTNEWNALWA